jgi:hypothetical protein
MKVGFCPRLEQTWQKTTVRNDQIDQAAPTNPLTRPDLRGQVLIGLVLAHPKSEPLVTASAGIAHRVMVNVVSGSLVRVVSVGSTNLVIAIITAIAHLAKAISNAATAAAEHAVRAVQIGAA